MSEPIFFQSWSGGKDSTASIILEHIHGFPPSNIIFSEVMFDKKRGISGELPEHIDFIKNRAIPIFESWGHKVDIVHSEKDYLDVFFNVVKRSKVPERNGKFSGFPIAGLCWINSRCKISPIKKFLKQFSDRELFQYVGIASDEPERLLRLEGTNRSSLLARYGYTEKMAFDLCEQYGLLSPVYGFSRRGGCWFCPNSSFREFARLKRKYPYLWSELESLSRVENLCSWSFRFNQTFSDVDSEVDRIIQCELFDESQIYLWGCCDGC